MHLSEIGKTPALVIDLDRAERNIARRRLRPRARSAADAAHEDSQVARDRPQATRRRLRRPHGGEIDRGRSDGGSRAADPARRLPSAGRAKLRRLAGVARKTAVTVALDSLEAARELSEAAVAAGVDFTVRVEADLGLHRCGLAPGAELVALAKAADALPGLRLEGFQYYAGHLWPTTDDFEAQYKAVGEGVAEVRAEFEKAGLPLDVVSGGTSPTLWRSHEIAGQNEIRPGTYVYNDRSLVEAGTASWDDCAATLLVTWFRRRAPASPSSTEAPRPSPPTAYPSPRTRRMAA
ncbi:MAG: alanine racemase [Bryobacterales bacterium]